MQVIKKISNKKKYKQKKTSNKIVKIKIKNTQPIISLENVSLSFGKRKILDNVSFKINQGQILGMLGPNGVGKSTIFNLITGLINPVIRLKIVDFPTPLGPNIPKICPWLILKLTLSKIFLLPNDNDIFSIEIRELGFLKDLILNFLITPILFSSFD